MVLKSAPRRHTPRSTRRALGSFHPHTYHSGLRNVTAARFAPGVASANAQPPGKAADDTPTLLSDLISFESEDVKKRGDTPKPNAEELVERATNALEAARLALGRQQQKTPSRPTESTFTYSSSRRESRSGAGNLPSRSQDATRSALEQALSGMPTSDGSFDEVDSQEAFKADEERGEGRAPAWAQGLQGSNSQFAPQLQKQEQRDSTPQLDFAEPSFTTFDFISQDALDVERAKSAVLPPLQSVMELTTAAAPPQRGAQPVTEDSLPSSAGRIMEDGEGVLADGTRYKRESGETKGKNGYWFRWTKLVGISSGGKVEWEEKWWEASDWAGMKELGAEKSGCRADGAAWRETWREAIAFDADSGEPMVERTAHKWAQDAKGDEWEEKWGEHYWSKGKAHKWADKWAKDGVNVWHERWGEDYAGGSDKCVKYTDKWAERLLEEGSTEQWGEKWTEDFEGGKGGKQGETWSVDGGGNRYQRWWGENHFGNGWVQKYGNSTTGEQWDVSEQMDTYYNPTPHFGYKLALDHSPTLRTVPVLPRAGDDLGEGIDSL